MMLSQVDERYISFIALEPTGDPNLVTVTATIDRKGGNGGSEPTLSGCQTT